MKILKFIRNNILVFMLGIIVGSITIVLATETIAANLVTYDNSISHAPAENVKVALDDLYTKVPSSAGLTLVAKGVPGLSSTLIDGLYRYQGIEESASTDNVKNFICFGSNSCTSGTDKTNYLYRIIGIDANGQMKLIKWASIGNQTWNAAMATNGTGLNGSMFLTNTTYIPTGWEDRIAYTTWHYLLDSDSTVSTIGARELAATTTNPKSNNADSLKIGLMYVHDYADAYGSTPTYSNTSWIHLSKNSSNGGSDYDWTISRSHSDYARYVYSLGDMFYNPMTYAYSVRPVFYLTSSQVIASGTGTLADPYILQ